jgi:hypothetical protein
MDIPEGYEQSAPLSPLTLSCEQCHQQFSVYWKTSKRMTTPIIDWDGNDQPIYGEPREVPQWDIIVCCETCSLAVGVDTMDGSIQNMAACVQTLSRHLIDSAKTTSVV